MWLYLPKRFLNSSVATAVSGSESPQPPAPDLWCTSSGEPSLRPASWPGWKKRPWKTLLSGTTLPPSTADAGVTSWIASLAEARAKTYRSPESEPGSKEPEADSGSKCSGSLTRQGQLLFSGKTSEEPFAPRWTWLRGTLKPSATELQLALSELQTSVHRTNGSGSSFWLTPAAQRSGSNQGGSAGRVGPVRPSLDTMGKGWPTPTATDSKASGAAGYSTASGRHSGTTLTDADCESERNRVSPMLGSQVAMWRTPTARDGSGTGGADPRTRVAQGHSVGLKDQTSTWAPDGSPGPQVLANPAARDFRGANSPEHLAKTRGHHDQLPNAVAMWNTPRSSDGSKAGPNQKLGGKPALASQAVSTNTPPLPEIAPRGSGGLALNPRFVEALMGLPPGWSSPTTASSFWVTELFHNKPLSPGASAGDGFSEDEDE